MSENKADPLREALEPFGAYADLIDRHCGHQPDGVSTVITEPFTIGHYRRARAALAAPQPAAPSKLASSERLGPHYDGTRSITRSLTPDGGGVTTPTPQPAAPLGGREAILQILDKFGIEKGHPCRSDMADAILAAIPQERGVERAGEAGTYDDDGITHSSTYDEGITYAIMQLAELTGSKDWQIRDGSEDHATDVQDTIMDVLKCAGLYDDETGKLATIATTTANVVAGTDRAAIIEECALRLDDSAAYEDRHIEAIKQDHGLSETGRESLIEHAITRRTAFRQGALSIRYLPRHGKETGR